jgi:hypothetical protein
MAMATIKRVKGAAVSQATTAPVPARVPAKVKRAAAELVSGMAMPTEPFPVSNDIKDYAFLLFAQAGWGKTTLLSTFPNVVLLPTERGFKGIPGIYTLGPTETGGTITTWEQFIRGVELLEASDEFENVGVDTVDRAYALCLKYVCRRAGVHHPSEGQDRGKLWGDITEELLNALMRISATGRGLYITSHVREDKVERAHGADYTKIGPSLSGGTAKKLIAFVDFCFYGDYVGAAGTGVNRVLFTQGDDLIVSKARRQGSGIALPEAILLPTDETQDYEYLKAMFEGRLQGVDIATLQASGQTTKTVVGKIMKNQAGAALARLQGEGVLNK